jgi:hypothetical protein
MNAGNAALELRPRKCSIKEEKNEEKKYPIRARNIIQKIIHYSRSAVGQIHINWHL